MASLAHTLYPYCEEPATSYIIQPFIETCDYSTEHMPLRNDDKAWVQKEISAAIAEHLNPHGWRKLRLFLQTWSFLGGIFTVILSSLALAGAGWYYTMTRVDKQARFEATTTDKLDAINKAVADLQGILKLLQAQTAVSRIAAIPKQDLVAHKKELQAIKTELATAPKDAPNFWPTTFQVISLLSQAMWQLQTIGTRPLSIMRNVTIRTGAPNPVSSTNVLLKNHIEGLAFENSVIHFDPSVELVNVSFQNCVFIFPTETIPSEPLQKIGELLLASDLSNIKIGSDLSNIKIGPS